MLCQEVKISKKYTMLHNALWSPIVATLPRLYLATDIRFPSLYARCTLNSESKFNVT